MTADNDAPAALPAHKETSEDGLAVSVVLC